MTPVSAKSPRFLTRKRRTGHGVASRRPGRLQNRYVPYSKTSASQPVSSQPHRTNPNRLRKNHSAQQSFDGLHVLDTRRRSSQDAQKGLPARPQRAKRRRRTLRYVELLSDARTLLADFFSILLTGRNNVAKPAPKSFRASCLHPDRFNQPHVISGEGKLFSLEIIFHMLRVRGAGQREHPNLHRKPKDDLCKTSP